MFFNETSEIKDIAANHHAAIFVIPNNQRIEIKNAILLEPQEKSVITIEQVRNVLERLKLKTSKPQYILIQPADKMQTEAANAFLKNLEEPTENIHFVLITENIAKILPTICSRSALYFMKSIESLESKIDADEETKSISRNLLMAKGQELIDVAEKIAKKKDREYTLNVLSIAIKMSYKAYFMNGKNIFLKKIPKLLDAYDSIAANGHIKLHLIADLC